LNEARADCYDEEMVDPDDEGVGRIKHELEETLFQQARPEDAIIEYRIDDTSSSELEFNPVASC